MRGAITTRDVLLHPVTIVRVWGLATYLHCLRAAITGTPSTFLAVLHPASSAARPRARGSRG